MDPVLLHARADDEDARILRGHPHRLLDHAGHTDRLEDDQRPNAIDLAPCIDRRRLTWIDDDIGAQLSSKLAPLGGEVGNHDRADPAHAQLGHARKADRSGAEHDGAVTTADSALRDRMHADGQRFGERSHLGREARWDLDAGELAEHHQFGVATVVAIRVADRVQPLGVECDRQADHDVADGEVAAARPELDDFDAELVAHHRVHGWFEHLQRNRIRRGVLLQFVAQPARLGAVAKHVEVASADPAGEHLGEHLPGTGCGVGNVVDPQLPITHHGCTHVPQRRRHPSAYRQTKERWWRNVSATRTRLRPRSPASPRRHRCL